MAKDSGVRLDVLKVDGGASETQWSSEAQFQLQAGDPEAALDAAKTGTEPISIPTTAEDEYRVSPKALEEAINENTRLLILCSPSNPTGSVYPPAQLVSAFSLAGLEAEQRELAVRTALGAGSGHLARGLIAES